MYRLLNRINHKAGTFSRLFRSQKMHLLVTLLGFFTDQNDRFLYPLIHVKYWNPHPCIYLKPEKKKNVPLSRGASPYRPWQGVSFLRIDKSPSAVLFVHYAFVFSPKYSILMLHCFHWNRMLGSPPPPQKKSVINSSKMLILQRLFYSF